MIAYRNPQYTNGRAAGSAQSVVELCDPVYYVSPLVTLSKRGYSNVACNIGCEVCRSDAPVVSDL